MLLQNHITSPGADPGFKVRGTHLNKLRRAEGGAKIVGAFRVNNHDFTPKNHIFSMLSSHQISKLRLPYLWQIPVNRQIIRISTFINYIHYDLTTYPLSFNSEGNLWWQGPVYIVHIFLVQRAINLEKFNWLEIHIYK